MRPYRAWRGGRSALAVALAMLAFALYPQAAGASVIFGPPQEPRLELPQPFLFQLLLPQVGLGPDACDLSSVPDAIDLQPQVGLLLGEPAAVQTAAAAPARAAAVDVIHYSGSAPWLVPRGTDLGPEWVDGRANGSGSGDLTATAGLTALALIQARLARLESCRQYLLHLLETINDVVLGVSEENPFLVLGSIGEKDWDHVQPTTVRSYVPIEPQKARNHSEFMFNHKAQANTGHTAVNLYRSAWLSGSKGQPEAANPSKRKKNEAKRERISVKKLVMDVLSSIYTYIFLIAVTFLSIMLQRRLH